LKIFDPKWLLNICCVYPINAITVWVFFIPESVYRFFNLLLISNSALKSIWKRYLRQFQTLCGSVELIICGDILNVVVSITLLHCLRERIEWFFIKNGVFLSNLAVVFSLENVLEEGQNLLESWVQCSKFNWGGTMLGAKLTGTGTYVVQLLLMVLLT
jgi:hypothetical protein